MKSWMTIRAEKDGGTCHFCGCQILKGDLLLQDPERGARFHRCCYEAATDPKPRECDRYA